MGRQRHSDADDHSIYQRSQVQLTDIKKQQEGGRVVLPLLETQLINVACEDPGAVVGTHLILPLLQERLDRKALEDFSNSSDRATEVGFSASGLVTTCSALMV